MVPILLNAQLHRIGVNSDFNGVGFEYDLAFVVNANSHVITAGPKIDLNTRNGVKGGATSSLYLPFGESFNTIRIDQDLLYSFRNDRIETRSYLGFDRVLYGGGVVYDWSNRQVSARTVFLLPIGWN